jgi:hypothetical protein
MRPPKKKLMDIEIQINLVLVKKSQSKVVSDEIRDEFKNQKITLFSFSSKYVLGYRP